MIISVIAYEILGELHVSVSVSGGPEELESSLQFWRKGHIQSDELRTTADGVAQVAELMLNLAYGR